MVDNSCRSAPQFGQMTTESPDNVLQREQVCTAPSLEIISLILLQFDVHLIVKTICG